MSLALLSVAILPGALAAVLELPVSLVNTYPLVDVEVGTPAVSHSLLFDTGSSTTWVFTTECVANNSCPNYSGYDRTPYDQASSSTAENLGTYASIEYLGGVTAGKGVEDVFSLPSAPNTTWVQSFLAADQSSWTNIPSDGFLGLAFSTIADAGTTTLVETLLQDGLLTEPRFALYYGTERFESDGGGTLTFGGSNEDVYVEGDVAWASLNPSGESTQLWRVDMQYLVGVTPAADNTTTTGATGNTTVALSGDWGIFDTGAGRISVSDARIEEIYASIGMNWTAILEGDVIPLCEDFTDAWAIEFSFGDGYAPTTVTLTGEMLKKPGFATGEDKYCWPPLQSSGVNGLFLFGGEFLQHFYTVFDFGGFTPEEYDARIGFGQLKEQYKSS